MAGRPSDDQQFANKVRDMPTVLSIVLGLGSATTLDSKAGLGFWATIRGRYKLQTYSPAPSLGRQARAVRWRALARLANRGARFGGILWFADRWARLASPLWGARVATIGTAIQICLLHHPHFGSDEVADLEQSTAANQISQPGLCG
jgi:hypothetical protein